MATRNATIFPINNSMRLSCNISVLTGCNNFINLYPAAPRVGTARKKKTRQHFCVKVWLSYRPQLLPWSAIRPESWRSLKKTDFQGAPLRHFLLCRRFIEPFIYQKASNTAQQQHKRYHKSLLSSSVSIHNRSVENRLQRQGRNAISNFQ